MDRGLHFKRIFLFINTVLMIALAISCRTANYWEEAVPESQGFKSEKLGEISAIIQNDFPDVTSILVTKDKSIVFEEYYKEDWDDLRHIWSVTRSFTSAVISLAIDKGYISGLDQKVLDFFPDFDTDKLNPYMKELTVRHLLTMTAGLNDSAGVQIYPEDMEEKLRSSEHLRPGSVFINDNNCPQLLSMIISSSTGRSLEDFGGEYLLEPLGITEYSWNGTSGNTFGANALYLSSRDIAKLGLLFLNNGSLNGKDIISSQWVTESTNIQVQLPVEYQTEYAVGYGFNWWIISLQNYTGYMASGRGGQYLCVIPELDLIIVITSEDYHDEGFDFSHLAIIDEYVIPSLDM